MTTASPELWRRQQHRDDPPVVSSSSAVSRYDDLGPPQAGPSSSSASAYVSKGWSRRIALDDREPGGGPSSSRGAADDYEGSYYGSGGPRSPPLSGSGSSYDRGDRRPRSPPPYNNYSSGSGPPPSRRGGGGGGGGGGWDSPDHALPPRPSFPSAEGSGSGGGGGRSRYSGGGGRGGPANEWPERGGGGKAPMYERDAGWSSSANGKGRARLSDEWESAGGGSVRRVGRGGDWESDSQRSAYERDGPPPRSSKWDYQDRAPRQPPPHLGGHSPTRGSFSPHPQRSRHPSSGSNAGSAAYPTPRPSFPPNSYRPLSSTYPNDPYPPPPANGYRGYGPGKRSGWDGSGRDVHDRWNDRAGSAGHDSKLPISSSTLSNGYSYPIAAQDDEREEGERDEDEDVRNIDGGLPSVGGFIYNDKDQMDYGETALSYEDVGVASSPVRPKAKKEPSPAPSSPLHASPPPPPPAARASPSSMDINRETPTAPPSPPPPPPPAQKATTVSPPSPASLPSESPASTSQPSRPSSPPRPASPLPPPPAINTSNPSSASTSPPPPASPPHQSSASDQPVSALTPKSAVVVDFAPPASPIEPAAPAAFAMPPSPPPTASSPTAPPPASAPERPELTVETAPSEDVEMASPTTKLTTSIVVASAPSIAPVPPMATLEAAPASPVKVPTSPSPAKPVPAVVASPPPKLPVEGPPPDQHVELVPKDGVGGGKRKRRKIAAAEPEPEAVAMDEDPAEENGEEEQKEEQEEDLVVRLVQGRITSNDRLGPAETDSIIATNLALLDPPSSRLPTVTPTITGTSSSSELVPAALAISLPLEDLPSSAFSTAVRVRVQSNRLEAIAKTERLRNEYRTLNTEWRANCARLERLSERRQQQQATLASAKSGAAGSGGGSTYSTNGGGGLFGSASVTSTPGLGSFLDESGARGSLARTSRSRGPGADLGLGGGIGGYFGDAVRSEAEFQLILASLEEADQMDPNLRAAKTTAIVPDMILDEVERDRDSFDDTNGLVLDPEAFFAESVAEWTEEEKAIFQRRFASHPKQFGKIAEHLPNKTAKECVLYYYRTKKTIDYRTIVASRGGSKRKGGRRAGATKASLLLANLDRKKAKPLVPTTRPPVDDTSSAATLRAAAAATATADEDSAMESGPSTPGPSGSSSVAAELAACNAPAPTNGRKRSRVEALAGGVEAAFTPGVPPDLKRSRFQADQTTPTSTPTSRRTLDDIADSQSSQNRADPDVLSRPSAASLVLEGGASPTPGAGNSSVKRPRPRTKKKAAAPSTLGDPNAVPLPATTTKPRTTASVSMASVLSSAPSTPADENGLSSHSVSSATSPAAIIGSDPSLGGQPAMAGATAPTKRKSSSVNSYWSMSEKAGFLKSLEQHGKDWAAISRALASCGTGIGNSKTAVQVRNYFQSNAEQLGLEAVAAEAAGAKEAARGVQALTISSEERKPVLEPFPSRMTGLFAVPPLSPPHRTLSPLMTTAGGDVSRPPSRGMSLFNLLNAPDSPGKTIGSGGIARKGPASSLDIKPPAGMSLMDSVIGAGARPAVSRYSESLGSPSAGMNGGGHGHHSTHGHSLGHGPSPPPPRWGPTPPSLFANSSRRSSGGGSSIHDLIHRPSPRGSDHAIPSSLPIPPRPYSASSASWAPPPPPHVASSMSASSSHPPSHPQPHLPAHNLHHPVSRPAFHAAFDNPAPVGPPFIKNGWHDVQRSTASAGSSGSASPSPAPFPMGGEPIRQHRP